MTTVARVFPSIDLMSALAEALKSRANAHSVQLHEAFEQGTVGLLNKLTNLDMAGPELRKIAFEAYENAFGTIGHRRDISRIAQGAAQALVVNGWADHFEMHRYAKFFEAMAHETGAHLYEGKVAWSKSTPLARP